MDVDNVNIPNKHATIIIKGALRDGFDLYSDSELGWINAGIDRESNIKNPMYYVTMLNYNSFNNISLYHGQSLKETTRIFIDKCGKVNAIKSVLSYFRKDKEQESKEMD